MRFVIQTFGCKVNQYEIIGISNAMTAAGFTETEDISSADVVIINSCTVTENSSKKAFTGFIINNRAIQLLRKDF